MSSSKFPVITNKRIRKHQVIFGIATWSIWEYICLSSFEWIIFAVVIVLFPLTICWALWHCLNFCLCKFKCFFEVAEVLSFHKFLLKETQFTLIWRLIVNSDRTIMLSWTQWCSILLLLSRKWPQGRFSVWAKTRSSAFGCHRRLA